MDRKIFLNFTIYDLWKLIGATLLFFLALIIGVRQVGEPATMIKVDYFSQEKKEEKPEHPSANLPQTPLESLCEGYSDLCTKVVRSGEIAASDQLSFVRNYLEIINFLDKNLTKGNDIKKTFQTLILNVGKGKKRGGATWKRITINLASLSEVSEFWGVLSHEFGHIVDLGVLQGKSEIQNGNYTEFGKIKFAIDDPSLEYYKYSRATETIRSAAAQKKDFCSGYGMSNPFEDFAECQNLFLNNASLFKAMAGETPTMKNKYNYFANLFNNASLRENAHALLYKEWRPWDTTLI